MSVVRGIAWRVALALICSVLCVIGRPVSVPAPTPATSLAFVGEEACASCHAREAAAWKGSQHQLAMQPATAQSVLGNFDNAALDRGGVVSRFSRRDGRFFASTDGPDGKLHEYEISYTFGLAPLQQYLVVFPCGRMQALPIAWDSRPVADGGQRWFHLLPGERIAAGDPLHWTGSTENWNYMCADCHSTNVRKGYDAKFSSYATSYAALSVSCEACHGPGSLHVAWAKSGMPAENKGLTIALDERAGTSWTRVDGKPHRSKPRGSQREIEMCARCHSRRGLIHEDHVHGQRLGDDYRVALLDDDLYFPDGQIKGEVYEYGSFVQSRMYAEGVTCSDCHDPHQPELHADGVCLRCHSETYQTSAHHFHRAGTEGARCVSCHMPAKTFMVVDPRRDHSLRVPRPDLTVKLGVPNACNGCHQDRSATWAAKTVERWYGHTSSGFQQFAEALAAGTSGVPGAQHQLAELVGDRRQPAIARASALDRMAHNLTPATLPSVRAALSDPDALVRRAAASALADVDPQLSAPLLTPLLRDAVRTVRIEAAAALAEVPPEWLSPIDRDALELASREFVDAQELNADRPESHLALARHYRGQQRVEQARSELVRALAIDPAFVPAAVNLADLHSAAGHEPDAESVLRAALGHAPDHPALLHALGLVLVREQRLGEATEVLGAAARRGEGNARFGYVYAVALHDGGRKAEALRALESVLSRHPYDRDTLAALESYSRQAGDERKARRYAERLAALDAP